MRHTYTQFRLLRERRFAPFFVTQFLGAFNDNVYKNALVTLLAFQGAPSAMGRSSTLIIMRNAIFILPFFLFSAMAGQLADKYEKSRFIRYVKLLEIAVMLIGSAGLMLNSLAVLLATLFSPSLVTGISWPTSF